MTTDIVAEAEALIDDVKARSRTERDLRHLVRFDVKDMFRGTRAQSLPALAVGQTDDLVFEHLDSDSRVGSFRIWRSRVGEGISMEDYVDGRWVINPCD